MKVRELIELLGKANPEDEVVAYDPDSEQSEPVSGMLYGGRDGIVSLQTDSDD